MNNKGFTLIEILVAIALIVVLATVLVPNLGKKTPSYKRQARIAQLNGLTRLAWHNAIVTNKIHKIVFNMNKSNVHVEIAQDVKDDNGEPLFKPLKEAYITSSMSWPEHFKIRNFFIEGFDEMSRFGGGRKTGEMWFFIVPEGLAQEVTINMLDINDITSGKPRQIGLVLNPFTAQFKVNE